MNDLDRERAYVRRIERRFLSLRGGALTLSPRDFALLLDWYGRGIPSEVVIAAIEELFERTAARPESRRIQSLAYCRKAVERAWEERRLALLGAGAGARAPSAAPLTPHEISQHLVRVAAETVTAAAALDSWAGSTLAEVSPGLRSGREELVRIAATLRDLEAGLESSPLRDLSALERQLVLLEEKALEALKKALSDELLEELVGKAEEALLPFASRLSDRARSASLQRALYGVIRQRANLPRYSLLASVR